MKPPAPDPGGADPPAIRPADCRPLTQLLHDWQAGDAQALRKLLAWVHGELLRMAQSGLRGQATPTLDAADLLQQTLMKLMDTPILWQDRAHFFATVSLAMRQILIDHARARSCFSTARRTRPPASWHGLTSSWRTSGRRVCKVRRGREGRWAHRERQALAAQQARKALKDVKESRALKARPVPATSSMCALTTICRAGI